MTPGAVGTRDHAACLFGLREDWRLDMVTRQTEVLKTVTPKGGAEMVDLLSAWPTYVDKKCSAVAAEKEEADAASARLGCEISEIVLISAEFQACLEQRSPRRLLRSFRIAWLRAIAAFQFQRTFRCPNAVSSAPLPAGNFVNANG